MLTKILKYGIPVGLAALSAIFGTIKEDRDLAKLKEEITKEVLLEMRKK